MGFLVVNLCRPHLHGSSSGDMQSIETETEPYDSPPSLGGRRRLQSVRRSPGPSTRRRSIQFGPGGFTGGASLENGGRGESGETVRSFVRSRSRFVGEEKEQVGL